MQTASAYVFGINGFALALPQALAGVLSVPLLYGIVKRQFGTLAGLIAAATLAVMPIAVAVERNNAVDGLLLFVLLLATWAFLRAVRLPALYTLYLLGAPHRWRKRIAHFGWRWPMGD